jgi:hypothetical protein
MSLERRTPACTNTLDYLYSVDCVSCFAAVHRTGVDLPKDWAQMLPHLPMKIFIDRHTNAT